MASPDSVLRVEVLALAGLMILVATIVGTIGTFISPRWVRRLPPDRRLRWDDTSATWVPAEQHHSAESITSLR